MLLEHETLLDVSFSDTRSIRINLVQSIEHGSVLFEGPLVAEFTSLLKVLCVGVAECDVLVAVEQAFLSLVGVSKYHIEQCFLIFHNMLFCKFSFLDLFLVFFLLRCPALDEINV